MISSAGYTASIAPRTVATSTSPLSALTDPQAQFRLEARPDQLVAAEHVARRPAFQDAAEHRLMEAELLLDRHRRQPHLPADLPLARGDATRDDAELDAVGLDRASGDRTTAPGKYSPRARAFQKSSIAACSSNGIAVPPGVIDAG